MTTTLKHPLLGLIRGRELAGSKSVQYSGIPYATISQRFGRSTTLLKLPTGSSEESFDATKSGPECIQLENATKLDADGNQFPSAGFEEQPQSENCLYLNVTAPTSHQRPASPLLPVIVFIHGGAFFLGSSTRPYYSPINFAINARGTNRPHVFVSINYRLGALGFLHSPEAPCLIPPNNGLHDQLRAFDWIQANISGFGGDRGRITALGQSAGGESVSLHTISGNHTPLFKQMIAFSGSPVTMPCKTPVQHQENFLSLAQKLGIQETEKKSSEEIAREFISAPISKIRDLAFVGAPCSSSEVLPYEKPTMALSRSRPASSVTWLKRAIYSSATFDGGVSYNILINSKKDVAKTFMQNVHETMSPSGGQGLLDLYEIRGDDTDEEALRKTCQFESDIGFFGASLAQVQGSPAEKKYLQIFDLKNPFDKSNGAGGALPKDQFATHTWDIVSLLGCYDDRLDAKTLDVVREWRNRILDFVCEEDENLWPGWDETDGKILRVTKEGLKTEGKDQYMNTEDGGRRKKLFEIAEKEKDDEGADYHWEGVCRRWLDSG